MNSARRANTARVSSVNRSSLLTRSTSTKSLFDAPSPSLEESEVKGNKSRRGGSMSVSSEARNEIMRDYYAYRRDSFSPVCVNSVTNSQFLWENPEKDYEIIQKGNWVLLGVGSPSEKRYALLHGNHYEEYMNIFKLKRRGLYPTHCSLVNSEACQDESVEKDSMNQISFLLNQLVYRVSVDYAIEMNDDILQELRSFQEDCWENENNITEKRYELLLKKQMNHRKYVN